MKDYLKPSTTNIHFDFFVSTQGTGVSLDCDGPTAACDVGTFGAGPCCGGVVFQFLVPGVNCADINNGADCTLAGATTPCVSTGVDSFTQCAEGCVVVLTCDHGASNCTSPTEEYTASCVGGFTSCAATAQNNC